MLNQSENTDELLKPFQQPESETVLVDRKEVELTQELIEKVKSQLEDEDATKLEACECENNM